MDSMEKTEVTGSAAEVESLDAAALGRWLVTTQGSTHVWDIRPDRVLYQRVPGENRGTFTADGVVVTLTRVDRWPAVGSTSFLWFDDLDNPHSLEQWRQSSTIRSIRQLPEIADCPKEGA